MLILENQIYNTDVYTILTTLREELHSKGINLLNKMKRGQDNIMITCPYHSKGLEKNPSCGVSVKDGIVHCFSCGKVSSLTEMISYCLGFNDNGEKGRLWLSNKFSNDFITTREVSFNIERENEQIEYVKEEELGRYRFYHPYMFQRKLTEEIINRFDVGFDTNTNSITFPVRDLKGRTLFIARRRVDLKFFHYPSGVQKPLYGIYEMNKHSKEVIICESIFNCLTCYVYGKDAIALNGTGTKEQLKALKNLSVRTIYIGLDNDDAGNKGAERLIEALKGRFILKRMIFPIGKDINDLEKEEFYSILENSAKIV